MQVRCVWEHHGDDTILYADNFVGAFTRGATKEIALSKMPNEIAAYLRWRQEAAPDAMTTEIVQEKESDLHIRDADSDVIFDTERRPLTRQAYAQLKALALTSAMDFRRLYECIPDPDASVLPSRQTFYGSVPRTAREMYEHTKSVNSYYFGEIGVPADNEGTIAECRRKGLALLEAQPDFLSNTVYIGSGDEAWNISKVLRRFVWHDRIHAKAMYRMAEKTFGIGTVKDIFRFYR